MALRNWLRAFQRNAREGVWLGLVVALGFAAWATFQYLRGRTQVFDELHVSLGAVIGAYLIGGLLCGALYGALKPLRRYTLGVMLVSFVCGALAYGIIGLAVGGLAQWSQVSPFALFGGAVAALFFGLDDAWTKFKRHRASARAGGPPIGAA